MIGTTFKPAFSQAEYERMIREALLQNEAITNVDQFTFSQTGARLTIGFEVISIYGSIREAVTM
ncbi:hypothetical protein MALU111345_05365 [Marinicrinis lubricantis]